MPARSKLGTAIALTGVLLVSAGLAMFAVPFGLITLGAAVVYVGYRMGG